jgi:hypothetical protein
VFVIFLWKKIILTCMQQGIYDILMFFVIINLCNRRGKFKTFLFSVAHLRNVLGTFTFTPLFCKIGWIKAWTFIISLLSHIIVSLLTGNAYGDTNMHKEWCKAGCQGLTLVTLATQEAELRRIMVWSQPGQIVLETLSWKILNQKMAGGVAQVTC